MKKKLNLIALSTLFVFAAMPFANATNVSSFDDLQTALTNTDTSIAIDSNIDMTASINQTLTANTKILGSDDTDLFAITGDDSYLMNFGGSSDVSLTLEDINIYGLYNSSGWGGLYISNITLYTSNVVFSNNYSQYGGAISNGMNKSTTTGTLYVEDSYFNNNTSYWDGGAIWNEFGSATIIDSHFTDNASIDGLGGAIYNYNNTGDDKLYVSGSTFTSNEALWGGAVHNDDGTAEIIGSTFTSNEALRVYDDNWEEYTGGSGGAIYNYGNITITDSDFISNEATWGAGIYNDINSEVLIYGGSFESNEADWGGAIYNSSDLIISSDSTGTSTIFTKNDATSGAAIYNWEGDVIINDSTSFTSNTASYGAVIYNDAGTLQTNDSTVFTSNKATDGGVFYNNNGGTITINDSTSFTSNTATDEGGVFYNYSGTIIINGGVFTSNTADEGGVIYNVDKIENINATFTGNTASYFYTALGGAIYNKGSIGVIDSVFTNNGAISTSTSSTTSNSSYVGSGGAIYNTGSIVGIEGSFTGNYATTASKTTKTAYMAMITGGGAIYNSDYIGYIKADFSDNYTTSVVGKSLGGAIYSTGEIGDITGNFSNNSVTSTSYNALGGAIYTDDKIGNISGNFTDNSAYSSTSTAGGGAIYAYYGTEIGDIAGDFSGNSAVSASGNKAQGGALYIYGASSVGDVEGNFTNNYVSSTGDAQGGAICVSLGTLVITSSQSTNYVNVGNFATTESADADGNYTPTVDDDENGGFLYLNGNSASVEFATALNSSITIGDGSIGYDSIASNDDTSTITKTGTGTLTVNSSMVNYTGTLNVEAGEMAVNNGLGASSITISKDATLSATIKGNDTFTSDLLGSDGYTYSNSGTLKLIASVGLTETSYSISASEYITNLGTVIAYGGTVTGNTFTVSTVNSSLSVDDGNEDSITIKNNGILSVSSGDTASKIVLSFNADSVDVTSVSSIATSDSTFATFVESNTAEGDIVIASEAFYFDIDLDTASGDTVVVSFLVGEGFDISQFTVYHSEDGSTNWEIADISDLSYQDSYLSFIVDDFSAYGYSIAVPEPSTYAMIFGALALGLAVYRRRK